MLTLLLELLSKGRGEAMALPESDKAVETLALYRVGVADHGCLSNGLVLHQC